MALGHARLRQGERGEHADGVERDQLGDVGLEEDDRDGAGDGQGDDAVGEHQAVAALGELLGHERVVGVEAGQAGEVGEAGVGRQHQDEHGGGLGEQEQHVADGAAAVDRLATCAITVFCRSGTTWSLAASHEMPRNMMPRQMPMTMSV